MKKICQRLLDSNVKGESISKRFDFLEIDDIISLILYRLEMLRRKMHISAGQKNASE